MKYEEQLKIEKINKEIFDKITTEVSAEDFIAFYKTHNQKETLEYYGIRTTKQLTKILKFFNYDFSVPKGLAKGKPSTRTHESYVEGGKKSAETQRNNWRIKPENEKKAWSEKQKIAHSSGSFRNKISQINIKYAASMPQEVKDEINAKKSKTLKEKWVSYTEEEKEAIMTNRFKNGRNCANGHSKPNDEFAKLLDAAGVNYTREICFGRKRFDFCIPDNNILIEINPTITHNLNFNPFGDHNLIDKYYHLDKTRLAESHNYRCIHIFDWDDPEKIIQLLTKKNTIYARDCEIKEVELKVAKEFINNNHLQGYARDKIRLGLFYNNELVSIMTFNKPRYNKNYDFELIRYCSSLNIIGGAEKLFARFVREHQNASIISYCDLSKFSGQIYLNLGFTLLRAPTPSKHWVNYRTGEHYTDNLLRQQGFSRLIHHCDASEDNLSTNNNEVLMLEADFLPVYDCGQAAYTYQK